MRFFGWLEDESGATEVRTETTVDVLTGLDRVAPDLATPARTGPVLGTVRAAARERLRYPGTLSAATGMEILHWNLARGADPAVETVWRALLRGEGVAVVTGQQPALLGGPLYTLYKLLTAIELAAELERSVGCPALAVFWVVGDDADFGEVSAAWLPGSDGSVRRVRDEAVPPGGTMIGTLPAARQLAALDAAWSAGALTARAPEPRAPDAEAGSSSAGSPDAQRQARDRDLVATAVAAGEDWSGCLAALAFHLLPGVSCLFVDGAHPAVVREQSPWIREAARTWPLGELLREGEAAARTAGFEPALEPALGERAAFQLTGGRREAWDGEPGGGSALGPNVVLRPLLQDLLLPNAATVCGPSEVRYRAQLGSIYRHAGIPRPPLVPRLRAVLLPPGRPAEADQGATAIDSRVPPADSSVSPTEAMPPVEAFRDPDAYLARRTEEAAPVDLLAQADALRSRTRQDLASLSAQSAGYDAGLPQVADSVAGKVDFQLQRIREGILARARQKLLRSDSRLARWREFVRPRDGEQERSLSLLSPFLLDGLGAADALREAARGHLQRWDEGRPAAAAIFTLREGADEGRQE